MLDMDLFFMREAVKEARKAFDDDEVPVGCVIVHKKKIIARAHNQIERLKDPTAHAEMLALTAAANALEMKWLNQSSVYVTIEPCAMCSGALVLARVEKLFYGADDPKTGACGSVFNITDNRRLNHRIKVRKGLLAEECGALVSGFFARKRAKAAARNN
ncbi:MAG: nucleoside deaminase [Elusimicrobia bacterium]|nr:nucleoside deaminase [Elusimicrobiota bacterium]